MDGKSSIRPAVGTHPRRWVEPSGRTYINVPSKSNNHQEQSVNLEPRLDIYLCFNFSLFILLT